MIAERIYKLPVDKITGKLREPKPGGGLRIVNLPEETKEENAHGSARVFLENKGWVVRVESLPRSTLSIVHVEHKGKGLKISTPAMPEKKAVILGVMLAINEEKANA